jgi:F-type H+-transporting ATPase subunit b
MSELGINLGFFLFQVFNFTIVLILLYAWAYKPLLRALDNRKKKIAQGFEDARIASEARANAEAEADRIITEARTQASKEINEASSRAETAAHEILVKAEQDAQKIHETAYEEAKLERERSLSEIRGQIAALAMAATQKLVGEVLDERRQHALIQELFSGIKSGKVTVLEDINFVGASAEVTSALPLTTEEQATVKKEILSRSGNQQSTISFRIDQMILGGLIIKVGDKVLDGSVSGQLESLKQNLR